MLSNPKIYFGLFFGDLLELVEKSHNLLVMVPWAVCSIYLQGGCRTSSVRNNFLQMAVLWILSSG